MPCSIRQSGHETCRPTNDWRNTLKLTFALWAFAVLWTDASIAQPDSLDDVYTTRTVVTGKDERNRPLGFKLCFEDVLVKASGDASIVSDGRFETLAAGAGQYVSTFSYRDRLEGKPVHDEQGTYDRPHFLTCRFDPQKIDSVLKTLGRKPWLEHRPRLVMLVAVHGRKNSGILSRDGVTDCRSLCRVPLPSEAIRLVLIELRSSRTINCRKSPSCRTASYHLSATCDGATQHLDGSQRGASRRAGAATAGLSVASIMTKRFGTLSGARRGCYLATVNPCEDLPPDEVAGAHTG